MVREKIVVGEGTQFPLNGLLTLPDDLSAPVPAVVFVHGSGSSNMDEKVGKLTPFRDLAEGLARHGVASLRYDKRTLVHARKMRRSGVITVKEETVEDAVLAAELLRKDGRIDAARVFIVGHSMGAMLAPRIDAEGGDFRGLILMAGTLRTMGEILKGQSADMTAEMKGLPRRLLQRQLEKFQKKLDGASGLSDEEAKRQKYGGGVTLYYFKEMDAHPASEYLRKTEKPILVMQGEKDVQVKASVDFAGYQKLLGDRENVRFRLYGGLNHAFVPSLCGKITRARREYGKEQHIGEDVIKDIADFIHEN